MPFFSIVTPFVNRISLLLETIRSIQSQTYTDWELILVDDGSGVDELNTLKQFIQNDQRIRYLRNEGALHGAPVCRNLGLKSSLGEWVLFFDSDDLMASTCLELRHSACVEHNDSDMLVFQTAIFNEQVSDASAYWNCFSETCDLDRFINADVVWPICGPVIRRSYIEKNGLHFDVQALSYQDWEWHIRLLNTLPLYVKIPFPINVFVRRNSSYVKNSDTHHDTLIILNRFDMMLRLSTLNTIRNKTSRMALLQLTMLREVNRLQSNGNYNTSELIQKVLSLNSDGNIEQVAAYLRMRERLFHLLPVLTSIYTKVKSYSRVPSRLNVKGFYNYPISDSERRYIQV
jgi:glycosyltransferase involved in cell wall biosynthesis